MAPKKKAAAQAKAEPKAAAKAAPKKAKEIEKKGEKEFAIEVYRFITDQQKKIRQGYQKKVKQIENQYLIAKIKARQEVMCMTIPPGPLCECTTTTTTATTIRE